MNFNIQFAVVREDPIVEQTVIEEFHPKNVLMIASGGCTALSLKILFPSIAFTLFDINPKQLDHVRHKISKLKEHSNSVDNSLFNIGQDNLTGLNACGMFESLFRSFRNFIFEFICPLEQLERIFTTSDILEAASLKEKIFQNKYWPVAFDLFFSDSMLITMFGKDATQHAKPGSYPRYFQQQLDKGLNRDDFQTNYFLHHIFLGYYLDRLDSLPLYLEKAKRFSNEVPDFTMLNSDLLSIKNIKNFQLVDLSNIFDWMSEERVMHYIDYLSDNLLPGSIIIFRQLNNSKNYLSKFDDFRNHQELSNQLIELDRSLFYNNINILEKL